eukprot:GGOE01054340.1.p1 GENE.GGOE01054340.1~~GGOE01054340.1.p1  ORF type:complete len:365 (+),score=-6.24 GGOE01054340.1:69-1163(+)
MTVRVQIRNPRIASGYRGPYRQILENIPLEHLFKVYDLETYQKNVVHQEAFPPGQAHEFSNNHRVERVNLEGQLWFPMQENHLDFQGTWRAHFDGIDVPTEPLIEWEYDVVDELANWPDLFQDFQIEDGEQSAKTGVPALECEPDLVSAAFDVDSQVKHVNPHKLPVSAATQPLMRPIVVPETTDSVAPSTELPTPSQRASPEDQESNACPPAKACRRVSSTLDGIRRADCLLPASLTELAAQPRSSRSPPIVPISSRVPPLSGLKPAKKTTRSKSLSSKRVAAPPPPPPAPVPAPTPAPSIHPLISAAQSALSSRILELAAPRNKRCLSAPPPQERGRQRNVWMPAGNGSDLTGGPRSYNVRN